MKLKKIARLKDLSNDKVNRLAEAYNNEGYETEIIPTYIARDNCIKFRSDEYELHVYKLIKRNKRWYTINDNETNR
jgi:hypothetical protein